MKRILLPFLAAGLLFSCKNGDDLTDGNPGGSSPELLRDVPLIMEITETDNRKKIGGVDIEGDSAAVHTLARYMIEFHSYVRETGIPPDFIKSYDSRAIFQDELPEYYRRDTLNHTFSFWKIYVVNWELSMPIEETVHLGSLVCSENLVFLAVYDTMKKGYVDPLNYEEVEEYRGIGVGTNPAYEGYGRYKYDTLGYSPNSMMIANRTHLDSLLKEGKYTEMVEYFKDNYHIYTCTGEEYRELVKLGLN